MARGIMFSHWMPRLVLATLLACASLAHPLAEEESQAGNVTELGGDGGSSAAKNVVNINVLNGKKRDDLNRVWKLKLDSYKKKGSLHDVDTQKFFEKPGGKRYVYGYSIPGGGAERMEAHDGKGHKVGKYSYTDATGKLVEVHYKAGPDGFQVITNNLPKDTSEVAKAKKLFHKKFNKVKKMKKMKIKKAKFKSADSLAKQQNYIDNNLIEGENDSDGYGGDLESEEEYEDEEGDEDEEEEEDEEEDDDDDDDDEEEEEDESDEDEEDESDEEGDDSSSSEEDSDEEEGEDYSDEYDSSSSEESSEEGLDGSSSSSSEEDEDDPLETKLLYNYTTQYGNRLLSALPQKLTGTGKIAINTLTNDIDQGKAIFVKKSSLMPKSPRKFSRNTSRKQFTKSKTIPKSTKSTSNSTASSKNNVKPKPFSIFVAVDRDLNVKEIGNSLTSPDLNSIVNTNYFPGFKPIYRAGRVRPGFGVKKLRSPVATSKLRASNRAKRLRPLSRPRMRNSLSGAKTLEIPAGPKIMKPSSEPNKLVPPIVAKKFKSSSRALESPTAHKNLKSRSGAKKVFDPEGQSLFVKKPRLVKLMRRKFGKKRS